MDKTTIAISRASRDKLGKIKKILERETNHFVDMDETIDWLIENTSKKMKISLENL